MRVLFVIPTLGQGGAQRVLVKLANSLAESATTCKHSVTIATFASPNVTPHHVPGKNVQVHYFGTISGSHSSGAGLLRSIKKLRAVVQKCQPQIVVAFQDIAIYPTIFSCTGSGAKLVISERQDTRFYRLAFIRAFLRWAIYRMADKVVVQTDIVKQQMPRNVRDRTIIIPNASPDFSTYANPSKMHEGVYKIISVGRLEYQKNFSLLIAASEMAFKNRDDWKLVIYGEGSLKTSLKQQITELQLHDKVELAGLSSSVYSKLADANLFVFPSRYEGFPNVLAEASGVGLPCIAYKDVSGVEELIEHDVNGLLLLTNQRNALSLASAMESLMNDPHKRDRMGTEGIALASRYHQDSIFSCWNKLLHSLASSPE